MNWFKSLPIRFKLNLLLILTTATALAIASTVFFLNDMLASRRSLVNQLEVLSQVVADNSVAAVTFHDNESAAEVLRALKREPAVMNACIYDDSGDVFALLADHGESVGSFEHSPIDDSEIDSRVPDGKTLVAGVTIRANYIDQVTEIQDGTEHIGYVFLRASTIELHKRTITNIYVIAMVLLVSLVVSTLAATRVERFISRPIVNLAETANVITSSDDYSVRVNKVNDDEIGALYSSFNNMLEKIQTSRDDLRTAHAHLEDRVAQRTQQLTDANTQLVSEVLERASAQEELQDVQNKLVDAARRAGMADVATGVLHNVGNILNSVNVSAGVLKERSRKTPSSSLQKSAQLLDNLTATIDAEGRVDQDQRLRVSKLADYLKAVAQRCDSDSDDSCAELDRLVSNIDHIKRVVASQQTMAKASGLLSELDLAELLEEAIDLHDTGLIRHGVRVEKDFQTDHPITSDKHRILQILVNLVSNAKQSVDIRNHGDRIIKLAIVDIDGEKVRVSVTDNGAGIKPENLSKVFSYGFTTKKNGHGFGLHASALAAYELGGSLAVSSEGEGKGATFTLELPYKFKKETAQDQH